MKIWVFLHVFFRFFLLFFLGKGEGNLIFYNCNYSIKDSFLRLSKFTDLNFSFRCFFQKIKEGLWNFIINIKCDNQISIKVYVWVFTFSPLINNSSVQLLKGNSFTKQRFLESAESNCKIKIDFFLGLEFIFLNNSYGIESFL